MEQFQGLWKTKNQNMANLCEAAKELSKRFLSFQINHVLRVCMDTSYFLCFSLAFINNCG